MKRPKFTDGFRGRYRTASESREPGYLARRFEAYRRLARIKARAKPHVVTPLRKANER